MLYIPEKQGRIKLSDFSKKYGAVFRGEWRASERVVNTERRLYFTSCDNCF